MANKKKNNFQKISTQLLTVLTNSAIVPLEKGKKVWRSA